MKDTGQREKEAAIFTKGSSAGVVGGRLIITERAIADIVGWTVLECYGVVGMASPSLRQGVASLLSRDRLHQGIRVEQTGEQLRIKLYIIVEYGLNVAEVAGNVRSQVAYNVERMTGRPLTALQIYVQGVRVGE
ncbi:MAG: Asp23/Gls24 family envelope stress response protein [Actinobacteria bacterium]|nr:Asp23/Gls24 family envelope stress response protein [Actinomycetota bacterium]